MGKKRCVDAKNKAVQDELRKQAEIIGIKEDDPILKEALENVVNVKGSSKGRNFILKQELDKLNRYVDSLNKEEMEDEKGDLNYGDDELNYDDKELNDILNAYECAGAEIDCSYGKELDDLDSINIKNIAMSFGDDFAKTTVSFGKKQIENIVDMFKNREKIKESIIDKYDKWKYGDVDYTGEKKVSYSDYLKAVESSIELIESGTGYVYNSDGKGGYTKTLILDGKEINTVESSKDEYLSAQKESLNNILDEKDVDKNMEKNFEEIEK